MVKITYTGPATTSEGGSFDPALVSYRHVQGTPASVWLIPHNLGFHPAGAMVIDSGGSVVEGEIEYLDTDTMQITFYSQGVPSAFSGQAYLS